MQDFQFTVNEKGRGMAVVSTIHEINSRRAPVVGVADCFQDILREMTGMSVRLILQNHASEDIEVVGVNTGDSLDGLDGAVYPYHTYRVVDIL